MNGYKLTSIALAVFAGIVGVCSGVSIIAFTTIFLLLIFPNS